MDENFSAKVLGKGNFLDTLTIGMLSGRFDVMITGAATNRFETVNGIKGRIYFSCAVGTSRKELISIIKFGNSSAVDGDFVAITVFSEKDGASETVLYPRISDYTNHDLLKGLMMGRIVKLGDSIPQKEPDLE